jgi:hypothetical protein
MPGLVPHESRVCPLTGTACEKSCLSVVASGANGRTAEPGVGRKPPTSITSKPGMTIPLPICKDYVEPTTSKKPAEKPGRNNSKSKP